MTPSDDPTLDYPPMDQVYMISDVFSTGRTPEATYFPRSSRGLEDKLRGRLLAKSNAITVFGPSKSGKTSLVERVLPRTDACWFEGSSISSIADFWRILSERLDIASSEVREHSNETTKSDEVSLTAGPKFFSGTLKSNDTLRDAEKYSYQYSVSPDVRALEILERYRIPIVIDDFHHIDRGIRKEIARAIKPVIRHACVVLVAIPSQAFDPVKEEPDLNGRIQSVQIPAWSEDELVEIASKGFSLLNVEDHNLTLARKLANSSFGSPHVMQQLCFTVLVQGFGVTETKERTPVNIPDNFKYLLEDAADSTEPPLFSKLLQGKKSKGEARKAITLAGSKEVTDSYGLVLRTLRDLTPPMQHSLRDIKNHANQLTEDRQRQEIITNALRGLHDIAHQNRGDSDPIVSYEDETVYIEDSVFAFYLNHGPWLPASKR